MSLVNYRNLSLCLLLLVFSVSSTLAQPIVEKGEGKRPKLGLVLSGGGAKGFAYIGMLKVMQEAGLPVDYVGGTSIGSIIAGLYAVGYHPDSIAKIIRAQDWDALLKDEIESRYIAYEEKEFGGKSIVSLPFKEKSVQISASLYEGQEINMLLNRYFSPAYKESDFSKLQTPFICIGTDLLDGNGVVLDKGNLAMAIRASMSIPGYFSPTTYMNDYLVDGGVVNNYPVKVLKERGAEIIVGADVQAGLYKTIEELNSLTKIIDQITAYHRMEANKEGYALTDLYVPIKMPYGMMDFESYDSIIAVGERVARQHFDEIKALADSLNAIEYRPIKEYAAQPLKTLSINNVVVNGSKKMNDAFFQSSFEDIAHHEVKLSQIEDKIRTLYGTKFFRYVFYELQYVNGETNLIIEVEDADPGYLSAAVHYDTDYKGSILLNATMRNVLGRRTKLFIDLVLGANPRVKALYLLDNGAKPGFGVIADAYALRLSLYEKDVKINTLDVSNYKASVFYNTSLRNAYNFRGGIEYEYARVKQEIIIDSTLARYGIFESYGNAFISINALTFDKKYFSTTGFGSELYVKYIMPLNHDITSEVFTSKLVTYLKYNHSIPLSPKLVLKPGFFIGATFDQVVDSTSKTAPAQHFFGFGGQNPDNYLESHVPFTGVQFVQKFGYYAWVARMKMQYEMLPKIYLTLHADVGANERYIPDIIEGKTIMVGYGLTASYNSFVGPVELTVMGSNLNPKPILFLNVGFWF